MGSVADFEQSADCLVQVLGDVGAEAWGMPGPDGWSVRTLAGQAARAILTVESYLLHDEPGSASIPDAETYYSTVYATVYATPTGAAVARADADLAGRWLGDDPVSRASDAAARTRSLIASQPAGRIVSIGGMGIVLEEYLRTRVLQLVVHTLDIEAVTGIDRPLPESAVASSVLLARAVGGGFRLGEARLLDHVRALESAPPG